MKEEYRDIFMRLYDAEEAIYDDNIRELEGQVRSALDLIQILIRERVKKEQEDGILKAIEEGKIRCKKCGGAGWVWERELEHYEDIEGVYYDYCGNDDTQYTCDWCDGNGFMDKEKE